MISVEEFTQGWDSERKLKELEQVLAILKGTTVTFPAATKADFDAAFGSPVSAVKYRTFPEQAKVWFTPCSPIDKDARSLVMLSDTQSTAQLAFAIPLRKLNIGKVPETRQWVFTLEKVPVEGGGTVYEMSFTDYVDQPRQVDAETAAEIKRIKAEQAKAKREQKRAQRLAKLTGGNAGQPGSAQG
jgi:hypothetical protein